MSLINVGYHEELRHYAAAHNLEDFEIGRIVQEQKDRYQINTGTDFYDAELMGNLRYTAESRYDLPAVGDWVAFSAYDEGKALIHDIYPRTSILERKAVGKKGQVQIIATNIDYCIIVQAVERDFNLNRLERYLTICHASKASPIIVLSKIDLLTNEELSAIVSQVEKRIANVPIVTVSNQCVDGYMPLNNIIKKGKTYCLLGSSGVGKSTLLNNLSGKEIMETGAISTSVNKGRHVTSHRELIVLDNGGILIDNPGMREIGITDIGGGLDRTFDSITALAQSCKFKDCSHTQEKGCAILNALDNGEIDEESYINFKKIEKEENYFQSDSQERKKKEKKFGKLIKRILKEKKATKF